MDARVIYEITVVKNGATTKFVVDPGSDRIKQSVGNPCGAAAVRSRLCGADSVRRGIVSAFVCFSFQAKTNQRIVARCIIMARAAIA
jgi:hypothetical protein